MNFRAQCGSVLLTVLVISLGTALLIVGLAGAVGMAQSGVLAEAEGRRLLAEAERGLAEALTVCATAWEPGRFERDDGVVLTLSPVSGASGRVLRAEVNVRGTTTTCELSAIVERGTDGLSLPRRAVAARVLGWDAGRTDVIVGRGLAVPSVDPTSSPDTTPTEEVSDAEPLVSVAVPSMALEHAVGADVGVEVGRSWTLDAGVEAQAAIVGPEGAVLPVPFGTSVRHVLGSARSPLGSAGERPVALVGAGDDPLDATGLGVLYAVILAGAGGVDLEGTVLHGGVFSEGPVSFGRTGCVVFDEGLIEWARYGSIGRYRLVPGTRRERFLPAAG